ncbi:alpha/beta fold hydrolase [Shewanella algae]|uniref:alpha/beta fold hydrolase n=1 Tax=Shewanella algae TaxID=38313 RepID=UPI00118231C3|nr:alpha/beta fold hydrolase [Shewanella algae]
MVTTQARNAEPASTQSQLETFWQGITHAKLAVGFGKELAYGYICHPKAKQAVVISNGRVESYLKYRELIHDFYQQGFSVYALDHIGQGLSSRLTANPHQGHIDKFQDYVDHLHCFVEQVVVSNQYEQYFLVGHSMGGAIGTLYLQQYPQRFTAAAFSAPMYGIRLPMPRNFVRWLAGKLNSYGPHTEPNYVLSGHDYRPLEFKDNQLTHSESRYQALLDLCRQRPEIQLGSPTNQWLIEALDACEKTITAAKESKVPILILQAEQDTIVDNQAQIAAIGPEVILEKITGARHELFIEIDAIREQVLSIIFNFLAQHTVTHASAHATESRTQSQTEAD